ncbi:hypothetical protein ACHAXS_013237 [Conticribra weissflogii]
MCRFRSAASSRTSSATASLWTQAIRSNQIYRMALRGAAISLTDTCRELCHIKANNNIDCDEDARSVLISMRETSVAILIAGVSASFLYLHSRRLDRQQGRSNREQQTEIMRHGQRTSPIRQRDSNAAKSWKVLVDAAFLASDLMSFRGKFVENYSSVIGTNGDDHGEEKEKEKEKREKEMQLQNHKHPSESVKESLTPGRFSPLENALAILNETLLIPHDMDSERNDDIDSDCERVEVALHSFRTALKVSALANDRLILPTLTDDDRLESASALPAVGARMAMELKKSCDDGMRSSKRQKMVSGAENGDGSQSVWDVKFSHHGDASLHSRERIADALSYHVASIRHSDDSGNDTREDSRHRISCLAKKKVLLENRDRCLQEAEAWESMLMTTIPIGHDADGMREMEAGESGGYVGYAWKIKHCVHGLDLASSLRRQAPEPFPDETTPQSSMPKGTETLHALGRLARSSSSKFSRSLLGCIHALRGEFPRAVDLMQKVLDLCEGKSASGDESAVRNADFDSDEEVIPGSVERRTVVNMALCFTALGEVNAPVELLLHLLTTDMDPSDSDWGRHVMPTSMLLHADSYEKEAAYYKSDIVEKTSVKTKLLWMLFHASSLAKEWATCLDSMEELNEIDFSSGNSSFHRDIALAFALLQCRRPSTAHDVTMKIIPILMSAAVFAPLGNEALHHTITMRVLLTLADLYYVDACLVREDFSNNRHCDATSSTSISFSPCGCTKRAIENIDFIISLSNNDMLKSPSITELRVTVLNDRGVALLMSGDSVGALGCFRSAISLTSANPSLSWLALPPYFNLSLLLLRDGRIEESCKSWLRARGHLAILESAVQGDNLDLQKLRDIRLMAINRHGLLMARRNISGDGMVLEQENVMEWVPPNVVGDELKDNDSHHCGVDMSQITALDVVLLRFAVSFAEKKAAAVFRRNSGGIF